MQLLKLCLAGALAVGVSSVSLAGETLSQAPELSAAVKAALDEFGVPGAAIGLWTPGGTWILATGLADVTSELPVRRRDYFAIRSITKSYTVTALLQLIAESHGALSLDDPISRHLAGVPNGEKLTLRQLANMTSGLYDYTQATSFREAFQADPTRYWTIDELLATAFDDQSHPPTNFEPGAQYQYSNTNTLVLGKLIEILTGRDFEDVLKDQILARLELDSTAYLSGTKLPRPGVRGYQADTVNAPPSDIVVSFSALGPAGAIAATLHDLAAWGRALADGSLLPPDLQQQRFESHPTSDDPGSPVYDAYGVGMGQVAGWWGHTGEGAGFEAAVFHQDDRNETFAVLLNASTVHDVPVRIFCRVLQVMNESPAPESGSVCVPGNPGLSRRDVKEVATE
jgi:D-alanyl-D-alanine carboxypeptidase